MDGETVRMHAGRRLVVVRVANGDRALPSSSRFLREFHAVNSPLPCTTANADTVNLRAVPCRRPSAAQTAAPLCRRSLADGPVPARSHPFGTSSSSRAQ